MEMRVLFLLIAALFSFKVMGNAPPSQQLLSFFKTPQSPLPSGEASLELLQSKKISQESTLLYKIQNRNNDHIQKHPSQNLWNEFHCLEIIEIKTAASLKEGPFSNSKTLQNIKPKEKLTLIGSQGDWLEVRTQNKQKGFIHSQLAKALSYDLGHFLTISNEKFLKNTDRKSIVLNFIPPGTPLKPISYKENFIKILYKGKIGFVSSKKLLHRAHFADWVYIPTKGWVSTKNIPYKNGFFQIQGTKKGIPIYKIQGFQTNKKLFFLKELKSLEKFNLLSIEKEIWHQSEIEGHELIWWQATAYTEKQSKKIDPKASPPNTLDKKTLTTKELLSKNIYSIAFTDKKTLSGLASSQGIYISKDGLVWNLLTQFGSLDYPVVIIPNGPWIVGPYISYDEGNNFEPFIRWDDIVSLIQRQKQGLPLKKLRMTKISYKKSHLLNIEINTESGDFKLQSPLKNWRWTLIENIKTKK